MSELPTSDLTVDLSRLPAPDFVASLSFEEIRADWLARFAAGFPAFDALVESDPAIKLVEAGAYRELLLRAALNDVGRATLLAFATGADLDQIGARFGVTRLVLAPANGEAPAVLEPDDALRTRIQLTPERFAAGGMTAGGYRHRVLSSAPQVADVALVKRGGGQVDVILLGRSGSIDAETIATVREALTADDVASLTDVITVRAATVTPYDVRVTLTIRRGPDPGLIRATAETAIRSFAASRARVGQPVFARMLEAAAAIGGVERVDSDAIDIDPGPAGAAILGELVVNVTVLP